MSDAGNSRLYDRVAKGVAAKIAAGEFAVGERLPSERELALASGVSLPTVREAGFALELDGLVEVGKGVAGCRVAKLARGGRSACSGLELGAQRRSGRAPGKPRSARGALG
jgi:DNA-binding FadR family transcriptional regulator